MEIRFQAPRRWLMLLAAVATIIVALPGIAAGETSPGVTYSAPSGCSLTKLCIYDFDDFDTEIGEFADSNNSWIIYASWHDDSSAYNNGTSGLDVRVYANDGNPPTNSNYCLQKGKGYKNHNDVWGWSNEGEANRWGNYC